MCYVQCTWLYVSGIYSKMAFYWLRHVVTVYINSQIEPDIVHVNIIPV